jgi:arsenate reductase
MKNRSRDMSTQTTDDVIIYHNPRCTKSRQTLELLQSKGIAPTVIEYLKTPPTAAELRAILEKLGKGPRDILRAKEAAEAGIAELDGDPLIEALAANPTALERPIVVKGDHARIGRPPETVLEIL